MGNDRGDGDSGDGSGDEDEEDRLLYFGDTAQNIDCFFFRGGNEKWSKSAQFFFLGKAVTILTIPIVLLTHSRETCFTEIYTRISYFAFFVLHVGICMLCILNYEQSWCSVGQTFVYVKMGAEHELFWQCFV